MKEKMLTLRITDAERCILEKEAKEKNMSISQVVRAKLNFYNLKNTHIEKENEITPIVICNIFTEIQKIRQIYPEIDLDDLEGSVVELCKS